MDQNTNDENLLKKFSTNPEQKIVVEKVQCPKQQDDWSCGYLASLYAVNAATGKANDVTKITLNKSLISYLKVLRIWQIKETLLTLFKQLLQVSLKHNYQLPVLSRIPFFLPLLPLPTLPPSSPRFSHTEGSTIVDSYQYSWYQSLKDSFKKCYNDFVTLSYLQITRARYRLSRKGHAEEIKLGTEENSGQQLALKVLAATESKDAKVFFVIRSIDDLESAKQFITTIQQAFGEDYKVNLYIGNNIKDAEKKTIKEDSGLKSKVDFKPEDDRHAHQTSLRFR